MSQENTQSNEKKNKEMIIRIIDWTLITALIIVVVYATVHGHYIDTKVIEVCKGTPINASSQFYINNPLGG